MSLTPEPLLLQEIQFNKVKRRFNMSTKSSRKLPSTSHEPVPPPQSTTPVPPQSATPVPPQSTTSVPPQSTTSAPPQPPQSTTCVPPQSTTPVPPQSTTSVPPQSATSMPPLSPTTPLTSKIHFSFSTVLKWKELPLALKTVVPINSQYTYIVEEYDTLNKDDFIGAPDHNFTVKLRINIKEEKHFKEWLQEIFEHSKCTYRTTRTYNFRQKRILYRVGMHCQHK